MLTAKDACDRLRNPLITSNSARLVALQRLESLVWELDSDEILRQMLSVKGDCKLGTLLRGLQK